MSQNFRRLLRAARHAAEGKPPICTCPEGVEFSNPTGHAPNCPRGFQIWKSQQATQQTEE